MYQVKTLNKISPVGLAHLTESYILTDKTEDADAILVRSQDMHEMEFSEKLEAIARAGAGVNNIPLDRCAKAGIVVFNTPGANANAVKELAVFAPEPLDVTVRLRISPDTEALRDAVRAEIEDVFSREGAPDSVLYRSHIAEAVSLTPGEQDHELLEPAEDVVVPAAYLPRLTQVVFEGEVESHA